MAELSPETGKERMPEDGPCVYCWGMWLKQFVWEPEKRSWKRVDSIVAIRRDPSEQIHLKRPEYHSKNAKYFCRDSNLYKVNPSLPKPGSPPPLKKTLKHHIWSRKSTATAKRPQQLSKDRCIFTWIIETPQGWIKDWSQCHTKRQVCGIADPLSWFQPLTSILSWRK